MLTWAPIFSKIVESSLWQEPLHVRLLFVTMLAKKDADQVVRANFDTLVKWANMPEEMVRDALQILQNPDTKRSDEQEYEGRRIEPVEGGWRILNGAKYKNLMASVRVKRWREKNPKPTVGRPIPDTAMSTHECALEIMRLLKAGQADIKFIASQIHANKPATSRDTIFRALRILQQTQKIKRITKGLYELASPAPTTQP